LANGDESRSEFLVDFVGGCLSAVQEAADDKAAEVTLFKLVSNVEQKKLRFDADQRSTLAYGAICGTYTIQLASRFGLIDPKWESYAHISNGKSGFYECVNQHCKQKYGRNLSSKEAREEVALVQKELQHLRHPVNIGVLDQVGCRWFRAESNKLKHYIYFWDGHNDKLVNFYRRKNTKKGYQIQLFWQKKWRYLSEYLTPFRSMPNQNYENRYVFAKSKLNLSPKWIRELPGGSIHSDLN
jgi:hypothetical protein